MNVSKKLQMLCMVDHHWWWFSSDEWPSVSTHNACSNTKHQTEIQFLKWCFSKLYKFSIANIKLNIPVGDLAAK